MAQNGRLDSIFHSGDENFINEVTDGLAEIIERERFVKQWLETGAWVEVTSPLNLLFTRGRIPSGRILDVGAGTGMMTHILADANPRSVFYGCDKSAISNAIEEMFRKYPECLTRIMSTVRHQIGTIHELNVPVNGTSSRTATQKPYQISSRLLGGWIDAYSPNIPSENGFFRAVTSFQAFHDMDAPDAFFSEVSRLTTPNGMLFMSIMNPYATEMLDSLSHLLGHAFQPDDIGVSTLDSQRCQDDILAQYLQRILVLAAVNGFEVKRIARFPFGRQTFPFTPEENASSRNKFNERFADRLGQNGYQHPDIDECPLAFFLEFKKKDPSKIFVPEIDTWIGYMDASVPERPVEKGQSRIRIEVLPQPSRSAGRSR